MERSKIESDSLQETLAIPWYDRRLCTQRFPGLYQDTTAAMLMERRTATSPPLERQANGLTQIFGVLEVVAMRQTDLAREVRDQTSRKPTVTRLEENMPIELWQGLLIPFAGTTLGAACVFFMRNNLSELVRRALTGFAAGVMVAASIWSLLLPAMEQTADMGRWSFLPAVTGFWLGICFLLGLDRLIPHLHHGSSEAEGIKSRLGKTTMLTLAVALHNIPEGMAVGAVYAGWLYGDSKITLAGALALSLGIAIQNFPEGAIISMPLKAEGCSKSRSFLYGTLSGAVEPVGAVLTLLLAGILVPALPYALSFAAGAMVYVVVEELIPEMSVGMHSNVGTILFAAGFTLMMTLDVALGA